MRDALAGPDGRPRGRLVIVGDGLLRHRNEEVQRRYETPQLRDCQAVHHLLRIRYDRLTLEEGDSTVNVAIRYRSVSFARAKPVRNGLGSNLDDLSLQSLGDGFGARGGAEL